MDQFSHSLQATAQGSWVEMGAMAKRGWTTTRCTRTSVGTRVTSPYWRIPTWGSVSVCLSHRNRRLDFFEQPDDLFHAPGVIRESGLHRRGDAQRLVNLREIVEHGVERDHVDVVFELL